MTITLLTSSRADFGIQLPLLHALRNDPYCELRVIAFGAHSDPRYGNSVEQIRSTGFEPYLILPPVLDGDAPVDIAKAMAHTTEQFATVWAEHPTELIIALGDRYEMFAAISASVPFGIPVAHIHGGETTLGAMDDAFRHGITHMATLHFTAAEPYRQRVIQLLGQDRSVYNTGALSIDTLSTLELLGRDRIKEEFRIDLHEPTVLVTVHPETVAHERTEERATAVVDALRMIIRDHRILITMPNADTRGSVLRAAFKKFVEGTDRAIAVENLGTLGYLSCMKHCSFMLGNTSSGYIEASFFPKHVIDLGDRQTGRIVTPNIQRIPFQKDRILEAVARIGSTVPSFTGPLYGDGHAADGMVREIRSFIASRTLPHA